jgi:hypothetical protein
MLLFYSIAPLVTAFLPVTALRATWLLCESEVTNDLANAERVRETAKRRYLALQAMGVDAADSPSTTPPDAGGGDDTKNAPPLLHNPNNNENKKPLTVATSAGTSSQRARGRSFGVNRAFKPSWWTKHRYLLRDKRYIRRLMILWGIVQFIIYGSTAPLLVGSNVDSGCWESHNLWVFRTVMWTMHGVISAPFFLLLVGVLWKLRRHHLDGYGLRSEINVVVVGFGVISLAAGLLSAVKFTNAKDLVWLSTWLIYFVVWCLSCLHPLYISYQHQDIMQQRLTALSKVTNLNDLLLIPEGYESFLEFARTEFNSEGVVSVWIDFLLFPHHRWCADLSLCSCFGVESLSFVCHPWINDYYYQPRHLIYKH